MNESPLLLRPEEAAEALGVSRSRLFELLAAGTIASVHIGRSRRIPRAALDDYVASLGAGLPEPAKPARLDRGRAEPRPTQTVWVVFDWGAEDETEPVVGIWTDQATAEWVAESVDGELRSYALLTGTEAP